GPYGGRVSRDIRTELVEFGTGDPGVVGRSVSKDDDPSRGAHEAREPQDREGRPPARPCDDGEHKRRGYGSPKAREAVGHALSEPAFAGGHPERQRARGGWERPSLAEADQPATCHQRGHAPRGP